MRKLQNKKEQEVLSLPLNTIFSLREIFKKNPWLKKQEDEFFNKICELLATLSSEEERNLVLILLENFIIYKFQDYQIGIEEALRNIPNEYIQESDIIYLSPIPGKNPKISKSGTSIHYYLSELLKKQFPQKRNKITAFSNSSDFVNKNKESEEKSLIILTDDFIGSATQAKEEINRVAPFIKPKDRLITFCIIALESGILELINQNIETFCCHQQKKGISERESFGELSDPKSIMERIEEQLYISDEYKFGYKRSEALVSMVRTPNNTFPLFWCRFKSSRETWWPEPETCTR